MWKSLCVLSVCSFVLMDVYSRPLQNLQVTLRGHQYDISDVETVEDLQAALEKTSGVLASKQGRVLFGGKRLSGKLEDAGVSDGAKLNLVPGKTKTSSSSKPAAASTTTTPNTDTSTPDTDQLDELMKNMKNGPDGKPPSMEESMEMMSNMMNSPIFQEYMNDPEKLEQSRQMILQNPLLKGMMTGMPGMAEILEDPVAWREAMQAAANLYKNMDPDDLMKAMMGGNAGGPPGGMFDGSLDMSSASSMASMAALDELSEGED